MKKNILYFTALLLLSVACKPNCEPKIPKGVKPIDWDNYNDIYTVKWNFTKECSDTDNDTGRDIKVFGWVRGNQPIEPEGRFLLFNNKEYNISHKTGGAGIYVRVNYFDCFDYEDYKEVIDSLRIIFATADITKKCYVSGKLDYDELPDNKCCTASPEILIHSTNDIYFEEK